MKKLIYIFIFIISFDFCISQTKIQKPEEKEIPSDSNFIFESPRPLIKETAEFRTLNQGWGMDVIFSNSGFGFGFFYQIKFLKHYHAFASLYMSNARNTDEFEYYDYISNRIVIPGKINRLFMFPLTFGVERMMFTETLNDNIRPYLEAGFGPTFILSTPFDRDFFESFSYGAGYTRVGGFFGLGSYFGTEGKSIFSVNARYYYIPFGGYGLESIQGKPMTDFGGLFLSLKIGIKY